MQQHFAGENLQVLCVTFVILTLCFAALAPPPVITKVMLTITIKSNSVFTVQYATVPEGHGNLEKYGLPTLS